MSRAATSTLGDQLAGLFGVGTCAGLSDGELLERFRTCRDEAGERAFEALVTRHGPMVLGVCRHCLDDEAEAHDAFQAVFLVLARRAGAIRKGESVGSWLYGVAVRVSARARAASIRRKVRDRRVLAAARHRRRCPGPPMNPAGAVPPGLTKARAFLRRRTLRGVGNLRHSSWRRVDSTTTMGRDGTSCTLISSVQILTRRASKGPKDPPSLARRASIIRRSPARRMSTERRNRSDPLPVTSEQVVPIPIVAGPGGSFPSSKVANSFEGCQPRGVYAFEAGRAPSCAGGVIGSTRSRSGGTRRGA